MEISVPKMPNVGGTLIAHSENKAVFSKNNLSSG
jgi:hypothetical protein